MDSLSDSDNDSDKELQLAFSKGLIKGKTVIAQDAKPTAINNKAAMTQILADIKSDLPWIERMDLTLPPIAPIAPLLEQLGANPDDLSGDEVHNDLKRELKFHRQAQAAVLQGIPQLRKLGVPTRRPDDYFAEMVKSDDHMKRVREKLLSSQLAVERSEKAKKLREMRKFGKKVQQEVTMRRQKEKKEMIDAVKKYRKGQTASLDFLDETKPKKSSQPPPPAEKKQIFQPNSKRNFKNEKFGFGGQKKRSKQNTKQSNDDISTFSAQRNAANPAKFKKMRNANKKNNKKNRPGKQKRQGMKNQGKR